MAIKAYDKLKHSIRYFFLKRLPPCQQTIQKISQQRDQSLSLSDSIKVKLHILVCAWCQWYMEHLEVLGQVARANSTEPPASAPGLSSEARERIKRSLTNEN